MSPNFTLFLLPIKLLNKILNQKKNSNISLKNDHSYQNIHFKKKTQPKYRVTQLHHPIFYQPKYKNLPSLHFLLFLKTNNHNTYFHTFTYNYINNLILPNIPSYPTSSSSKSNNISSSFKTHNIKYFL